MRKYLILSLAFFIATIVFGQEEKEENKFIKNTFSGTRTVIGQAVDIAPNGEMHMDIQHHFGPVNSGFYDLFGFDQAATRLGVHYSFNDWLAVGIGRTTIEKTWDGFLKVRILRQKTDGKMPVSLTYFGNIGINSLKWQDNTRTNYFSSRLSYTNQLIIARNFGERFSMQIVPTIIHRNLVEREIDDNDVFTLGGAASVKLSKVIYLNLEYHYILSEQTAKDFDNSLSLGIDIKTAGHIFQFFLTNSQGIIEQHFIPATKGKWTNGDIHIGFNIVRSFTIKQKDYF